MNQRACIGIDAVQQESDVVWQGVDRGPTIPQHLQKGQESAKGQSACDQPGWTPPVIFQKKNTASTRLIAMKMLFIAPALSDQPYRTSLGEGRLAIIYIPIEDLHTKSHRSAALVSCPANNLLDPPADFSVGQGAPTSHSGHYGEEGQRLPAQRCPAPSGSARGTRRSE
jgi:hypothetical protein